MQIIAGLNKYVVWKIVIIAHKPGKIGDFIEYLVYFGIQLKRYFLNIFIERNFCWIAYQLPTFKLIFSHITKQLLSLVIILGMV